MNDDTRLRWCAALAKLVQPDRAEEAVVALKAMLPMLSDLPEEAFESRSALDAVAMHKRRTVVPSYADIRTAVGAWWRENRPGQRAIAGPGGVTLDENDRLWVRYFGRRSQENFAAVREGDVPSSRASVLALVKAQSPRAYQSITGECAEPYRHPPSPEDREYVARAVQECREAAQDIPPASRYVPKAEMAPEALRMAREQQGIRGARS